MTDDTRVARKYATALFDLANRLGQLRPVWGDLSALAAAIEQERRLLPVLSSPQLSPEQKKELIARALGASAHALVRNFLNFLIDKGRTSALLRMIQIYRELLDEIEGIVRATITTAVPLPDAERDQIITRLEKLSGKSVQSHTLVDPALLGGVVVLMGGEMIDHTVRHDLERLRETLSAVKVHHAA